MSNWNPESFSNFADRLKSDPSGASNALDLTLQFLNRQVVAQGSQIVAIQNAPSTTIKLETNGILNSLQTVLNLIAGTHITLTPDGAGGVTFDVSGSGFGTVTSFSAGTLSPLFTTSVATATTTPALSFALSNAAAHKFFGNNTAGSAAPDFESIGTGDLPYTYSGNTTKLGTVAAGSLTSGHLATWDASGNLQDGGAPSGGGTVTSVAMTVPTGFSITGSPVTTSGTLALGLSNENANLVWAGPSTGSPAAPAFRSLVTGDLPYTYSGNTTKLGTVTGAVTSGHIAEWDASGNLKDGGAPGITGITVATTDGGTSVSSVTTVKVTNGMLTNLGSGAVSIDPGAAATPYSIGGLVLWCDAGKVTGLSNGAAINQWIDYAAWPQFPGGPGLTSAWSSAAPTYQTNVINSLPVVRFGGTSWMRAALPFDNYQWSIFMVFKMSSLSPAYTGIIGWSVAADQGGYFVKSTGKTALYPGSATNYDGTGTYTFGTTNFQVVSVLYDGQNFYTRAGLAVDKTTATQTNPGFPRNFMLFNQAVASRVGTGDVAEILFYNWYVGSTNISTIENYLKTKYGL